MNASIQYLEHDNIDKRLWDNCIDKAANGLVYAYSYYLDIMCTNWGALVLNDYEAVMPLPWKRKWGIRYVYQVPFMQRLGVFGDASPDTVLRFYTEASQRFLLLHYNISEPVDMPGASIKKRKNFLINLDCSYDQIKSSYKKEAVANIEKAKKRGCVFTVNVNAKDVIDHFRSAYGIKNKDLKEADFEKLYVLLQTAKSRNAVDFAGVANDQNELIYSAAIFKDHRRLYYVLGAPTGEGRKKRATYFFIDQLLERNADTPRLFDFEGSEIHDVAVFYEKFGPRAEYYYELRLKKLFPFL